MQVLFLSIGLLALVLVACSPPPRNTFQVVRECETHRGALRKCVVTYRVVPTSAQHYHYYFRAKELKTTAFQFLQQRGLPE